MQFLLQMSKSQESWLFGVSCFYIYRYVGTVDRLLMVLFLLFCGYHVSLSFAQEYISISMYSCEFGYELQCNISLYVSDVYSLCLCSTFHLPIYFFTSQSYFVHRTESISLQKTYGSLTDWMGLLCWQGCTYSTDCMAQFLKYA